MAGNTFGKLLTVTTFGESHGKALGLVMDGFPSKVEYDEDFVQSELDRRRPGGNSFGTKREEKDKLVVLSGLFEGKTTGAPIAALVFNEDQKSSDYSDLKDVFRPGHADYTYEAKWGIRDYRGGGRSSGRETLSRVAAGAFCKLYLRSFGIAITAGAVQIGAVKGAWEPPFDNELGCSAATFEAMENEIKRAKDNQDSVGGIVECHIAGLPAGLGEPCFDKLDARLASAILSIGSCKGFEVGDGFSAAASKGSVNNDEMCLKNDKIAFKTNHAGGILGGISTGEEVIFRAAFKPTPSISLAQNTVDALARERTLSIKGRHDPCVVPRALVVVEAMAALTVADLLLEWKAYER